jgi:hypothetical protein
MRSEWNRGPPNLIFGSGLQYLGQRNFRIACAARAIFQPPDFFAAALARSIILASDVVVIPVQPSPFDIWAAAETVELIKEARIYNENLKAVIAINCTIVNMAIGRAMCVKRWPA